MKRISSTEAVRSFGDQLSRVRHTGETILICKNDHPVATLGPPPGNARLTVGEFVRAWRDLGFDPGFADDLESVNRDDKPLENPWA